MKSYAKRLIFSTILKGLAFLATLVAALAIRIAEHSSVMINLSIFKSFVDIYSSSTTESTHLGNHGY